MNPILALWFEPGTAADAAAAINKNRAPVKYVSPASVRRHWDNAKKAGLLPPFDRPPNGFPDGPRSILLRFMEVQQTRSAA